MARGRRQQVVADGGELGQGLGDHPGLALADEHPHQRRHPRVQLLVLLGACSVSVPAGQQRARVACGPAQRARARARVGQRGRVPRGGAAGASGRGGRRRARRRQGPRGETQARGGGSRSLGRRRGGGGGVAPGRERAVVVEVGRRERGGERERDGRVHWRDEEEETTGVAGAQPGGKRVAGHACSLSILFGIFLPPCAGVLHATDRDGAVDEADTHTAGRLWLGPGAGGVVDWNWRRRGRRRRRLISGGLRRQARH